MSADTFIDRRAFVAGCVGTAGYWLLPAAHAARRTQALTSMAVIIDPRIEAAAAFGAALVDRGAQYHATHGDTYRFVRGVLSAGEPATITGMGTYADFIIATGVLREARYALVSHGLHVPCPADHHCVGEWAGCESALQRGADGWPVALAKVIAGDPPDTTRLDEPAEFFAIDTGAVLSWVMRAKSLRRFT